MLTVLELDALSQNIKTEINNKYENNFVKVTTDNIVRALYALAQAAEYDKAQISQEEIALQLKLSQNRVSELLKLAKKIGLIGINMICRCGDVRNEYTLLDNPIINTIKRIAFNSSKADPRESIELAISNAMAFYKIKQVPDNILDEVKKRIPVEKFIKANGILKYFQKTLATVERELLGPEESSTYKNKKNNWNAYPQRKYNFKELEKNILGTETVEEIKEEPLDIQSFLKEFRE